MLDEVIPVRVSRKEKAHIEATVAANPHLYDSNSHYVRSVLIRDLRVRFPQHYKEESRGFFE